MAHAPVQTKSWIQEKLESFLGAVKHAREDGRWVHHFIGHALHEWGVPEPVTMTALFVGLLGWATLLVDHFWTYALLWFSGTAPVWLPIVMGVIAWRVWVWYIRSSFIASTNAILLKIEIPREITKSPRAMEQVIDTLYFTSGESNFIARAWLGKVRTWFSLEIVSIGGKVGFYVWTWAGNRNVVESAFYAQFPNIEIHQVEDYSASFHWDPKKYGGYIAEYKLDSPISDPELGGLLPPKTYIDFELDKDPKEEFKVDPLAQILEWMSQLKPHEQVWLQIVHRGAGKVGDPWRYSENRAKKWREDITAAVKKIREDATQELPIINPTTGEVTDKKTKGFPNPTWAQRLQIEALERQHGKRAFEIGMRGAYIANKTQGNIIGSNIMFLRQAWNAFNNSGYMGQIVIDSSVLHDTVNYPWQDYREWHKNHMSHQFFDAYRRRSFFFAPYIGRTYFTTPEVLATMWHFPSSTITAPGVGRIPATKVEPPANLPIS